MSKIRSKGKKEIEKVESSKELNAYHIMVQFEKNKRIHTRFKAKNSLPETLQDETKRMLDTIPERKRVFLAK